MEENSLAWFEIERDPDTNEPVDIEVQFYGNAENNSDIKIMYINRENQGIFNETEVDNLQLRVFPLFHYRKSYKLPRR